MKKISVGVAVLFAALSSTAHAQDWFQFEAGIGASHVSDMGDGIWIQKGAPNNQENQNTPAFLVGLTGEVYASTSFDLRYHVDYVYMGNYSASVDGVPDDQYNPVEHVVHNMPAGEKYTPFNGFGHVQGIPVTMDFGYTWRGYRIGLEGGMWAYEQTWHESAFEFQQVVVHLDRKPKVQLGYVVGASISKGPMSLSYRYYQIKADWSGNACPGLATGAQVLALTYRF